MDHSLVKNKFIEFFNTWKEKNIIYSKYSKLTNQELKF